MTPLQPTTNAFLAGSVFLSFAYLAPNFELALFFILPVKIKWLALLTWIGYAVAAVMGDCSAGFMTTVFPETRAAVVIPQRMAMGKFQGAITAATPRP